MPSYELAAAVLRAGAVVSTVATLYTGCAAPTTTGGPAPTATSVDVPMVVDGPATARSGSVVTHSVYCIPADTEPFDLAHAKHWREVAINGTGDNPTQGSPCPPGQTLAAG